MMGMTTEANHRMNLIRSHFPNTTMEGRIGEELMKRKA
jgi:hypothetical protein